MNEILITDRRPQIMDFDGLPIPDRSLVNYEKYNRYIAQAGVKNGIALQATRGCPYHCAYCHKIWPKKHVLRTAENIFREVLLYYNLGVRRIAIIDDVFNFNLENSTRFLKLIIDNGLDLHLFFETGLRGDILNEKYIDLMVEAGLVSITLALETASPRLQKLIRKNMNLPRLRNSIDYICHRYPHVMLGLQTMLGFPTETEQEALMTLDFIKSTQWLHFPYVHVLKIFPNTDMEKLGLEAGISPEVMARSRNLAYHELPETLPFSKSFAFKYQTDFLHEYFLKKERFLSVLPHQLKILTEDEIVGKYNSYMPVHLTCFADLLDFVGVNENELGDVKLLPADFMRVPHLNREIKKAFPGKEPKKNALRILLLDLSQYFSGETDMLYDVVEPPLGLIMLLSYLHRELGEEVKGKIAKSRIDFDSYAELKALLEEFNPQVIGIRTLTFYKNFFNKTVEHIREWEFTGPIIAGGPHATSDFQSVFRETSVDLTVLGEGELTFTELITLILENDGEFPHPGVLETVTGIAFPPGNTKAQLNLEIQTQFYDDLENE